MNVDKSGRIQKVTILANTKLSGLISFTQVGTITGLTMCIKSF